VYVKCDITDSKSQAIDPVPEFYGVTVPPRKKTEAVVALGDIEYSVLPLRHTELEYLVEIAAKKYKNAGYEVQSFYTSGIIKAQEFFKNPRMQAVMIIGHSGEGEMVLSDKKDFGYLEVLLATSHKWKGCGKMQPTVKELQLLGCESHDDKWMDHFFRLDQYHAYRDKVWSTSFSSRIVDYINNYFKPSPPRIAPPY
jgi:hypothetical protein